LGAGRRKSGCTELAEGPERRFNRVATNIAPPILSSRRKPGPMERWIPAFAGMTTYEFVNKQLQRINVAFDSASDQEIREMIVGNSIS
jgi:hypothetical protein